MNNLEIFESNLNKIDKKNPYKVPNGYFDTLPSRVQEACAKHEAIEPAVSWSTTLRTQLALAAGICFFIMMAITGFYFSKKAGNINLYHNDYIKLVEESGTEFDEIQLYEAVNKAVKKDSIKNKSNDELMDYLFNDYIENGTLLEPTRTIKP